MIKEIMKQLRERFLRFFKNADHEDDYYYEEGENLKGFKTGIVIGVSVAALLLVIGLVSTISRNASIASAEAQRKEQRLSKVETVRETRSDEEKESLQAAFEEELGNTAESAISTVRNSKVFSVAVKGASHVVDFGKRIWRGDYLNGYPVPEDSYAIETPEGFELARVKRVVDGDTLLVDIIGCNNPKSDLYTMSDEELKNLSPYIRLLNINTQESVAPEAYLQRTGKENTEFGKYSSDYVKGILKEGDIIFLSPDPGEFSEDKDRYGRYLRLVWHDVDSVDKLDPLNEDFVTECTLNALLLSEGIAEEIAVGGNISYEELFRKLQSTAMQNTKGLWNISD